MNYINIEKFRAFLDENLDQPWGCYDFDACLANFARQVMETGSYELKGSETKDRVPATIHFEREEHYFIDGKEVPPCDDFDEVETTIIF